MTFTTQNVLKCIVITVATLCHLQSLAQSSLKVHAFSPDIVKNDKFKFRKSAENLVVNSSTNGHNTFIVFGDARWYIKSLDTNFNTVLDTLIPKPVDLGKVVNLGSSRKRDKIAFYYLKTTYLSQEEKRIGALILNLKSGSIYNFDELFIAKNILAAYPRGDEFFFSYITPSDDIHILQMHAAKRVGDIAYAITDNKDSVVLEDSMASELSTSNISKYTFFSGLTTDQISKGVQYIDKSEYMPIEDANSRRKYYHEGQHIFISYDAPWVTQIIDFNIEDSTAVYTEFNASFEKSTSPIYKTSSFIYDNRLFQVHFNKLEWQLNAFELNTGREIKKHHFDKDQGAPIANTPIEELIFETDGITTVEFQRILNKSAHKLTQALISVNRDNSGNINVDMGLVKNLAEDNYNGWLYEQMWWNKQMQFQMDMQNLNRNIEVPSFPKGGPSLSHSYTYQKPSTWMLYFTTVLDQNSLNHIPGTPRESQLTDYSLTIDRAADGLKMYRIYKQNDFFRMVYYDKPTKSFVIEEMKPGW